MVLLAAAAHFIEADRCDWTYKRKPGGKRKTERQKLIAEDQPGQRESRKRVDQADENNVRPKGPKILKPLRQDILEISGLDPAYGGQRDIPTPPYRVTQRADGQRRTP